MNVESGGIIQGSLLGTTHGATLTQGVIGNALYTDGISHQFVIFGSHPNECFHDPDMCREGVTYALWMQPSSPGTILTSGGYRYNSNGYLIHIAKDGILKIASKFTSAYDYYKIPNWHLDQWKHIVFTWARQGGIRLFINGCDADPNNSLGYYSQENRREATTLNFALIIGAAKNGTGAYCKVLVDELYAWHVLLQPSQIWKLYTRQGLP